MKSLMQYPQPYFFVHFLLGPLIVACSLKDVDNLSEGTRLYPQQEETQPKITKADLIQQEKELAATAVKQLKDIVQQFNKENAPNRSLFKKMYQQLKQDIKKVKKDPKKVERLVEESQKAQNAIQNVIEQLGIHGKTIVLADLPQSLQIIFSAVLNIPEVSSASMANGGIGRPINRDNLGNLNRWYEGVIQRNFGNTTNYDTHVGEFVTAALTEETQRLKLVIDANLVLFQNMLAQYELK